MCAWRKKPIEPEPVIDLKFFRDWKASLSTVWQSLTANPMLALILAVMCVVENFDIKIPFLALMEEVVILFLAYATIKLTWTQIKPQFEFPGQVDFKGVEARVVGVTWIFGWMTILLSCLLIAPGIWWATRSSLALVFVCLENLKPGDAIKQSQQLVRGNFWKTFRYIIGGPLLVLLAVLAAFVAIYAIGGVIAESLNTPKNAEYAFDFLYGIAASVLCSVWQLSVIPLMVRIYAYLKGANAASAAAATSGIYSTDLIDAKLNPRWNP